MIKIKLHIWKEVVRLEVVEGDVKIFPDIFQPKCFRGKITLSFWDNIEQAKTEYDNMVRAIEQYTNSIKDDGYELYCECKSKCNCKDIDLCCSAADWQEINNNKIEIVED